MSTKTESIRTQVFQAILRGDYAPGQLLPPEREMARLTDTSRVTVRRAYAELEQAGILKRRQGSGARIEANNTGHVRPMDTVAVLASLGDPFALEFIEAMEQALTEKGAFMVLKLTDQNLDRERQAAMELVQRGHRDLVVWPSGGGYDRELFARLRMLGCNLVFFDRMMPGATADYVGLDNTHAVEALVATAQNRGAGRMIFVNHAGLSADTDRLREQAFVAYCRSCNLAFAARHVPWRNGAEQLRALVKELRRGTSRPALICVNDDMALRVRAIDANLDLYSIDGLPAAAAAGITSVRQPMQQMARAVVHMLVDQQKQGARWHSRVRVFKGKLLLKTDG